MKKLNDFAAWLTLLLGLLATWLIIASGQYWALAIAVVVVLLDIAVVTPGIWGPRLQQWLGRGNKNAVPAQVGVGGERADPRRIRRQTNLPRRGDVCEVIEITPYNPNSKSVVRFHRGSGRTDHNVPRSPDDTLQILGQSGWSIFYSGTDAASGRRYWVLNRTEGQNRPIDDALARLQ
jgi:hypothetical protein